MISSDNFQIYNKLVDEVPIGLYKVRIAVDGVHQLVHCNQHFAESLGYTNPEEIIGNDIRTFHSNEESFSAFYNKLIQLEAEGLEMKDYIVEVTNEKGELRKLEVNAKLLHDQEGNIVGRVGAEKDVTDFLDTKHQLHELTTDIGKVLHSYSSTLIHSKQIMDGVIRTLTINESELKDSRNLPSESKIIARIYQRLTNNQNGWKRLLEKTEGRQEVHQKEIEEINRMLGLLLSFSPDSIQIQQITLIRDASIKILTQFQKIGKGFFPKQESNEIKFRFEEILKLCNLVSLGRGIDAILEMETNVNNLRSYILTRVKEKPKLQRIDLYDALLGVVKEMGEYATFRGVELQLNVREIRNLYIEGYETELVRALLNLVHNAIKYSWVRKRDSKSFVKIEAKKIYSDVMIRIENWGVAITENELQKKLIYKIGYRGINSSDRRRPGTGLGLHDSMKVIEKHKGQLEITSKPASMSNRNKDYSQPFITEAKVTLPIKQQE